MSIIRYSEFLDNNHVLNGSQKINNSEGNISLSARYHTSTIDQNNKIVSNAIKMIWVGIFLLIIGLVISVITKQDLLPLIPGAFVDLFSGTMIYLVNKSSENKQNYFKNLTLVEHEERIIELIDKSDNLKFKEDMITKIVEKHCKN
jgi:hypothetical protein